MKKTKLLPTAVLAVLILVLGVLTVKRATLRELEVALPTPSPAPAPTGEPAPVFEERDYVISCIGDCTLASHQFASFAASYRGRIGDDYAKPFSATAQYFADDELTLSNLECTLSDKKLQSMEQYFFLAPTAYAQILTQGGVDFVTTANNHMEDFGEQGVLDTYAALEAAGLPYGKEGEAQIIETRSGLKVGIYCAYNHLKPDLDAAVAAVTSLRLQGAEYIVCMFHWGKELYYSPNDEQTTLAHACIDAGADLIYGSHTHCLQPIEAYGDGIILYSLGNWTFGGSTSPTDKDTAIVQLTIHRNADGSLKCTGIKRIPCCVSGRPVNEGYSGDNYNDYIPTPYTEGSDAYQRALSKLDGTFQPDSEGRDYSDVYAQYG